MALAYVRRAFWRRYGEPEDIQFQRHIADRNGHLVGYVSVTGRHIYYGEDWCRSRSEPTQPPKIA